MVLLISGCLFGLSCRYDGRCKPLPEEILQQLQKQFQLVPICPEQLGGLPTPRPPAERRNDGFFLKDGTDVTQAYLRGGKEACKIAKQLQCTLALLKERSPACGSIEIYDGSFSEKVCLGKGAAAECLEKNGVQVFGESQIPQLLSQP